MTYRYLGNTGLKVSTVGLGTMTFAKEKGKSTIPSTPKAVAFQMLDEFHMAGGNFIDTADMYTEGEAEEIGTSPSSQ